MYYHDFYTLFKINTLLNPQNMIEYKMKSYKNELSCCVITKVPFFSFIRSKHFIHLLSHSIFFVEVIRKKVTKRKKVYKDKLKVYKDEINQ